MTSPDSDPDHDLGELFRSLPRETVEDEACPTPEELWASARGELEPGANRRILDHTGRCSACAEDWRLGRYLTHREGEAEVVPIAPRRTLRPPRWLATAAALVLMVGVGWFALGPGPDPRPRSGDGNTIEPLLKQRGDVWVLDRTDPVLRWSGPEGATYQVTLSSERLEPIAQSEPLEQTSWAPPPEALAGLPPDTILLWKIEAEVTEGLQPPARTLRLLVE